MFAITTRKTVSKKILLIMITEHKTSLKLADFAEFCELTVDKLLIICVNLNFLV